MKYIITLFILTLPLACSNTNSNNDTAYDVVEMPEIYHEVDREITSGNVYDIAPQTAKQKLIKESFLRFQTQDLDKTYQYIIQYVKQNNGFIQDDNSSKSYNHVSRHLIIRVPTTTFQKTIDSISKHVEYYDTKRISSKDVTEEFIDLEARLKAKRTLEKRYLELLSKAKTVKEILEIERELSSIREAIEAKQGRLKYLENKVSLSTLNIEFYKQTAESGVTVSYGSKMWNAIKSGFNGLSMFFLGILHIWPFILILVILFFILKRWLNKRQKK